MKNQNGVIQMQPSTPDEIFHLFEVMKKHGIPCSLEFQATGSLDPLIGITSQPIEHVEYVERPGGPDCVVVNLGELELGFDLGLHSFMKHITDCQIGICIASNHTAAWFNSGVMSPEAIEEAKSYTPLYGPDESFADDFPAIIAQYVRYLDYKGLSDDFDAWRTQPEADQE